MKLLLRIIFSLVLVVGIVCILLAGQARGEENWKEKGYLRHPNETKQVGVIDCIIDIIKRIKELESRIEKLEGKDEEVYDWYIDENCTIPYREPVPIDLPIVMYGKVRSR